MLKRSEQLSSSGKIVGEFVPPSSYISSQLLEYVTRRNAALASLQTKVCPYSDFYGTVKKPNMTSSDHTEPNQFQTMFHNNALLIAYQSVRDHASRWTLGELVEDYMMSV